MNVKKVINKRDEVLANIKISRSEKLAKYLYTMGLVIYLIANYLRGTMIVGNFGVNIVTMTYATYLGTFFVLLKVMLYDDFLKWEYLAYLALIILFYSIGKQAKDFDLFYYFIFIVSAKGIDFKHILKTFLIVNFAGILITGGLTGLDLIKNVIITRVDSPAVRYSLGAVYPTDLAARIFFMMLAYFGLKNYRFKLPEYISILALIILTYLITNTRLDFLLMLLAFIMIVFNKQVMSALEKIKPRYIYLLTGGLVFVTLLLGYIYRPGNAILDKINSLLSGRLFYEHIAFKDYNVEFLGQYIYQNGFGGGFKINNYFFIDSSYVRVLLMYGLVAFIAFMTILLLVEKKFIAEKHYGLLACFILVLLSSVIDQHILEISYNIFLLALLADMNSFKEQED